MLAASAVEDNLTGASSSMTAVVYQLRDFQSKKDQERIAQMAREIMSQIDTYPCEIPFGGAGIDGMKFEAPENDPA